MSRAVLLPWLVLVAACGVDGLVLLDAPGGTFAPGADGGVEGGTTLPPSPATEGPFDIQASQDFSCAIVGGRAYCWGRNDTGALGTGDTTVRLVPTPVATGVIFEAIALGANHACGIERDTGRVLCWGNNAHGQLGQGRKTSELTPVPVTLPGKTTVLTAGYDHTCAIVEPGALHCWGNNGEGQLGQDDAFGAEDALSPLRVGTDSDWTAVSGGQGHTCGVRAAGTFCWGRNDHSELGLGPGAPGQIRVPTRVGGDDVTVELGQNCTASTARDRSVHAWGESSAHAWSGGEILQSPTATPGVADVKQVSTDTFTTCALDGAARVFCWGRGVEGQLGIGSWEDRALPTEISASGLRFSRISVGRFHTCVMTDDHRFGCTGKNDLGQLGTGDTERRNVVAPGAIGAIPH